VAQAFQHGQRGWLLAAGDAADFGQSHGDAAAEQRQVPGGRVARHGVKSLAAGHVRLVDECAKAVCELAGPDGVRIGLGGVLKVAEQVLAAKLVT